MKYIARRRVIKHCNLQCLLSTSMMIYYLQQGIVARVNIICVDHCMIKKWLYWITMWHSVSHLIANVNTIIKTVRYWNIIRMKRILSVLQHYVYRYCGKTIKHWMISTSVSLYWASSANKYSWARKFANGVSIVSDLQYNLPCELDDVSHHWCEANI